MKAAAAAEMESRQNGQTETRVGVNVNVVCQMVTYSNPDENSDPFES